MAVKGLTKFRPKLVGLRIQIGRDKALAFHLIQIQLDRAKPALELIDHRLQGMAFPGLTGRDIRRPIGADQENRPAFQSAAEMKMIIERVLAHHQSVVGPDRLGAVVERYFAGQARPSAPPSLNVGIAPLVRAATVAEVAAMKKRSPVIFWVLGAIGVAAIAALVAAAVLSS